MAKRCQLLRGSAAFPPTYCHDSFAVISTGLYSSPWKRTGIGVTRRQRHFEPTFSLISRTSQSRHVVPRHSTVSPSSLAETEQPDLVITELLLPDMDGIDLLSRLGADKSSQPLTLVLSGKTADEEIAAALSAGAVDYVTKPFSPQGLLERIRVNLIRAGLAEAGLADPTDQER